MAAACALVMQSGCTSLPTPAIVALVGVPDPAKLSVIVEKHPSASGSIERSMFFIAEMHTKEQLFANALKPLAFAPAAALTEAIAEAFLLPGRSVIRATNPQRDREDFLRDYAVLGISAGLYIDIVPLSIGYWAESPAGAYRPWVMVDYRLYDSLNAKAVASGQIGTGPIAPGDSVTSIAPDNQFAFPSFEALTNDPARAVAGLRAAIRQVAQALARKVQVVAVRK